jgi:hypothetical protein
MNDNKKQQQQTAARDSVIRGNDNHQFLENFGL